MSNASTYIIFTGLILGVCVASVVYFIALDHNPQGVYTDSPSQLVLLLYGWVAAVSLPFTLVSAIIQLIYLLQHRP